MQLQSYAEGHWFKPSKAGVPLLNAATGEVVAECSSEGLEFAGMVQYAREVGGPALRALNFHERAMMLKELAKALNEHKKEFYALSAATGATKGDSWIDIDGGLGTLFVYSSKGRREMPSGHVYIDGATEMTSRNGTFLGQHVFVPMQGVAVHINAFNFPCWGMLEKLAPTLIAGMPAIVKPASATSFLTELVFRRMIQSGILPDGAVQLICGGVGDLLDHLTCQDVVSFTGSTGTAEKLSQHPNIVKNTVRFIAERDSLNSSILGPDCGPDSPEFELFVKEVVREMTVKAGQKCTAIRRALVPRQLQEAAIEALKARLAKVVVGDPTAEDVRMGPLASLAQRDEVREKVRQLGGENPIVFGDPENFQVSGADPAKGAFLPPILFYCDNPFEKRLVHDTEPFGPVSTVVPYDDLDGAVSLANMGEGSLVASLFTHDPAIARDVVMGIGAYHGRIAIIDRDSAAESTGHGSPLPHLKHGGPGRAGGGEELGGIRGVLHYMQRVALQGSPDILTGVTSRWIKGSAVTKDDSHPFRKTFDELQLGDTVEAGPRKVTLEDVEHFAHFTGDEFYAHMDEESAAANPFFDGRVAHGYLILSFAAGLFVDPDPGPVLANYGLNNLNFMKPLYPGDAMSVKLTAMAKTARLDVDYGEVRWNVDVANQDGELVANYELVTLNQRG